MSSQQSPSRPGESGDAPSLQSIIRRTLQQALRTHDGTAGSDAELRRSIRALADETRRRGLRAEQLVVALHEVWRTLPEARTLTPPPRRTELAARVVSVCIDEYYLGLRADLEGGGRSRETSQGPE